MKNLTKKIVAIVITIAMFAYLVYIYFNSPTEGGMHITCVTKTVFGFNCMGCGLTRFVYFAMHGNFSEALRYNVLGPLLIILLLYLYLLFMRWALVDKPFPNIPVWAMWTFLAFAIIYSVLRNIPWEPIGFLAPPN